MTDNPSRVRLSRARGWRMPDNACSVAAPTKWQNPFRPKAHTYETHRAATERYREALLAGELAFTVDDVRRELAGRDLACWCSPELPCHVDVLLGLANP